MVKMKYYILTLILLAISLSSVIAQEEEEVDKPVRFPWASGYLIDQQTTMVPVPGTLEFVMQHKFGSIENGTSDFFGIYSPGANIRLGLNYVPVNNLQLGLGLSKEKMYTDLNAKWTVVEQTRENTIPVAITLYGVLAIDGQNVDAFGSGDVLHSGEGSETFEFAFSDRWSYFTQLLISRKFTERLSLQAGASFTHFNLVDTKYDHDKIGIHFGGRYNFSPQSSFIFNYDVPLKIQQISEQVEVPEHHEPNLSVGWEISTSTHAFQIYVGNSRGLLPQEIMMMNSNGIDFENFAFGFVITRLWNF